MKWTRVFYVFCIDFSMDWKVAHYKPSHIYIYLFIFIFIYLFCDLGPFLLFNRLPPSFTAIVKLMVLYFYFFSCFLNVGHWIFLWNVVMVVFTWSWHYTHNVIYVEANQNNKMKNMTIKNITCVGYPWS